MENIKTIIQEEINKYIINENINSLTQYANGINKELNEIKNYTVTDRALQNFIKNFEIYSIQIINAINRCVKANSLNEGFGNWGIDIPPELGGNFWNDARRGYYNTKNFLTRGRYGHYNGNNGRTANGVDRNTVKSVKLYVLLRQYPQRKRACENANSKFNLYQQVPPIFQIIHIMDGLYNEYENLKQQNNAQGTNP